ncbi:hypothetical protein [Amaricoccus solimangrovi]|uniref:Uncharacterized protein n=1 Tax=Amaricoccus solimangrovi TaxID=2589815 RepID=A0A501WH50_9RHOB|nr:hypothetical protein [Amaricoccus solimangrovi]TPE47690.1 hypothetical protein FJM51_19415 [Amaricoccus solimangrovi]
MSWKPERDLASALRRFPEKADRVLRLAERDEAFRDMCEELAAAEAALETLTGDGSATGAARREECEGWIVRLLGEMSDAVREEEVIRLSDRRRR